MDIYLLISALALLSTLEIYFIFRKRKQLSNRDIALISSEWKAICEKIDREPKHAVLEADRLLDFVLKKRGYNGTLADKLRKAEKLFSSPDHVWEAHKMRNRATHEVGFSLSEQEARKAISYIKHALWNMGVKL